jgi:hypothetical protein
MLAGGVRVRRSAGKGQVGPGGRELAKGAKAVAFYSGGSGNCASGSVYYTGYYHVGLDSGQIAGCTDSSGNHLMGWYKSGAGPQHRSISLDLSADKKTFLGTYDELSAQGTGSGAYNGSKTS